MSDQPVWFITGVSGGFGLLLTLRALKAGHRAVGTVRNKTKNSDAVRQIEAAGGEVVEMDMTDSQESIRAKVRAVGRIDYLVNNAGYAIFAALEQYTEAEVNAQIAANVFGPVYVMQGALEGMRARRSGTIVNISSIAAKDPKPANALYAASKAALEATSESLAYEVASFNISILIVNPGAFRTNFLAAPILSATPLPDDYKNDVVGKTMGYFSGAHDTQAGDPVKGIERIFEAVTNGQKGDGRVRRLVIGGDAWDRMKDNNERFVASYTASEAAARSTAFD